MTANSRQLAATWPYPRYDKFRQHVKNAAVAWFSSRGFAVDPKYPYILADREDWPKNLILPEVAEFVRRSADAQRAEGRPFPLHKHLHNGLSSQALLFNLVGPLLMAENLAPLLAVLSRKGIRLTSAETHAVLEYEDRLLFNEDAAQPTSIDLALLAGPGQPGVFIEAKFVEQRFGACSLFTDGDCDGRNPASDFSLCYLHHIGRRYWEVASKQDLIQGPIHSDSTCALANHYQFFRELLFASEKGGVFVLMSDERSPVFSRSGPQGRRGFSALLEDLLPSSLQKTVVHLGIHELVSEMEAAKCGPWVTEFRAKYGLT